MFRAAKPAEAEATLSPMAGRVPLSRGKKIGVGVLGLGSAAGVFWLMSMGLQPRDRAEGDARPVNAERVGEVGQGWSPIPKDAPPSPPSVQQVVAPVRPPGTGAGLAGRVPFRGAGSSRTPIVAFELAQTSSAAPAATSGAAPDSTPGVQSIAAGPRDALSDRLNAGEDMDTAVATMLPDRNLFITMGTPMACTPEQPINTDQPGPFRCKVSAPVYATSGAVPLLDPGTWFFGQVRESLQRGRRRAFAVMTRIETPQGCLVRLRAPVADHLGEAGLDGEVDNHFWERFRGLAAVAFLDAASQAAATAASNALSSRNSNSVSFNQFGGIGGQAGQGFAEDTNIPPTLRRNQARPILVMAMQDLDMRPCFRLRTREAGR